MIQPIEKNICKNLKASLYITHRCRLCGNVTIRHASETAKEHKCQYCIKSQIDNR